MPCRRQFNRKLFIPNREDVLFHRLRAAGSTSKAKLAQVNVEAHLPARLRNTYAAFLSVAVTGIHQFFPAVVESLEEYREIGSEAENLTPESSPPLSENQRTSLR